MQQCRRQVRLPQPRMRELNIAGAIVGGSDRSGVVKVGSAASATGSRLVVFSSVILGWIPNLPRR